MFDRTVTPEDLARLARERDEADRAYNDALTALDRALQRMPDLPHPPPGSDTHQAAALNERWAIIEPGGPPMPASWLKRKLAGFVWRLVAPMFERQQTFNSTLVDHANRNLAVGDETRRSVESTLALLHDQLQALVVFEQHLIALLQRVTLYVDTRDRASAALSRDLLEGMAANLSSLGDDMLKRFETVEARLERQHARIESVSSTSALAQHTALAIKRAIARLTEVVERGEAEGGPVAPGAAAVPAGAAAAPAPSGRSTAPLRPGHPGVHPAEADTEGFNQAAATTVDAFKYVGFEEHFRGSQHDIRARLGQYVDLFDGASDVVDIGCGRGEFLELLRSRGVTARGVDLNQQMVAVCRERGLDAEEGDALGFLRRQADQALGGLIAIQVVEHLQPDYLLALLDEAYRTLRPGARLVLETINAASWFAFFQSYVRDITHVRPLHPDTLAYYVRASGFGEVRVQFSAPVPPAHRLRRMNDGSEVADTVNANVDRLNDLIFADLDYAVIATRG